jgi:hypothetical protein
MYRAGQGSKSEYDHGVVTVLLDPRRELDRAGYQESMSGNWLVAPIK